jgi:hypothetical protein
MQEYILWVCSAKAATKVSVIKMAPRAQTSFRESSANAMAKEQQNYHFIAQYHHHITLIFPSYNSNFSYFHIFSTPQPTSLTVAWQVELMKKRLASMIHSQSSRAEASSFFLGSTRKRTPGS